MSAHLYVSAGYLEDLEPSAKLVLMAFGDSADDSDPARLSAPGLGKLRAWCGLSKSRTIALVSDLVSAELLELAEGGHRGRRAVYRVFPGGVPPIPTSAEVAARFGPDPAPSPGNPQVGTTPDLIHKYLSKGSRPQDPNSEKGSRPQDPNDANGYCPPDPFGTTTNTTSLSVGKQQTARAVDDRPPAGVRANNGQAERPVAEILDRHVRPGALDPDAAATLRATIAAARRARATAPTPEESSP